MKTYLFDPLNIYKHFKGDLMAALFDGEGLNTYSLDPQNPLNYNISKDM